MVNFFFLAVVETGVIWRPISDELYGTLFGTVVTGSGGSLIPARAARQFTVTTLKVAATGLWFPGLSGKASCRTR